MPVVQWDRARNRLPNSTIFETLEITGIAKGDLGDGYFISACSALGEFEERLSDAFVTKTYNSAGLVVV